MIFVNRVKIIWLMILIAGGAYAQDYLEYVSTSLFHDSFSSVARTRNYIYCGGENGLQLFDISDSTNPIFVNNFDIPDIGDIIIDSNYAFINDGDLEIYDISVSLNPSFISSYSMRPDTIGGYPYNYSLFSIGQRDSLVILAGNCPGGAWPRSKVSVLNVADPENPTRIGSFMIPADIEDLYFNSNRIYVVTCYDIRDSYLAIIEIDTLSGYPSMLHQEYFEYTCFGSVAAYGDYVYICDYGGLIVLDISNPYSPNQVALYNNIYAGDIILDDSIAFFVNWSNIEIYDIQDYSNFQYIGTISPGGNDFDLTDNTGFTVSNSILNVIDLIDPSNPTVIGQYIVPGRSFGVQLSGNHAFVANGFSGIRPVDITDPYNPVVYENIETGDEALDIAINGNYAFLACYDAGLLIYDITDPENPVFAGSYDTTNATRFVDVEGDYAYLINTIEGVNDLDIVILNVYDPYNPVFIRVFSDLYWPRYLDVVDTIAYISCLYSLEIVNMANPLVPVHLANHPYRYTGNNLFVEGDYAYVAGSPHGLDIFDISNPENPYIIAYFDSLPAVAVGVNNGYACLSGYFDLYLLDVSDPASPVFIDEYADVRSRNTIYMREEYLYVPTEEYFLILKMTPTGFEFIEPVIPSSISLSQNYPNPFNAQTTIRFTLPKPQSVRLTIYDILGRQVQVLFDKYGQAGEHTINFDASGLSSGVYFYKLRAGDRIETKRMVLLK